MNVRSRGWCFTRNNYNDEDIFRVEDVASTATYLIYGKEVGDSGTPHLQGYVYFENSKSFSKITKLLPHCHLEVQKGTGCEASDYCKKDGAYKEFGTLPSQGKRNDIKTVKEEILQGGGMREIIEIASNYQTLKIGEMLLKYKEKPRNFKPTVVWIYGESGVGKTRLAYEWFPNIYRKTNSSGKWWDGYDSHAEVLIDDIKDNSKEMYSLLLELLDRYEVRVEAKGASRQFLAKNIIVTSIFSPYEMFSQFSDAKELLRRIDEVKQIF